MRAPSIIYEIASPLLCSSKNARATAFFALTGARTGDLALERARALRALGKLRALSVRTGACTRDRATPYLRALRTL
jgi:hypothetical protein